MAYAIDLSERQSARTLEQAVRHRARALVRSLAGPDAAIECRIGSIENRPVGRGRSSIIVVPHVFPNGTDAGDPGQPDTNLALYQHLTGSYCDVTLHLGESRYLFSSDVISAENRSSPAGHVHIAIARPDTIQVAQRRRFWRYGLAQSSQVHMNWTNPDDSSGSGVGWLCNVSADGLACRTSTRIADQLGIGERIRVDFTLGPGDPEHHCFTAALCNKTPAGTKNTMILGMQFVPGTGAESPEQATEKLRRRLLRFNGLPASTRQGADT